MDPIVPGIYCGSARSAEDHDLVRAFGITHVLSVGYPVVPPDHVQHLVIALETPDHPRIADFFDQAFAFIDRGRQAGNCLVHCYYGQARSPAICIAYLMRTFRYSFERAHRVCREGRPGIEIGDAFASQLRAYGHRCRRRLRDGGALEDTAGGFACRTCRTVLFGEDDVLPHERGQHQIRRSLRERNLRLEGDECTSYFLSDLSWVEDISRLSGRVRCPKCAAHVGTWEWPGRQCSCGTWVTPAFQIYKRKVDRMGGILGTLQEDGASLVAGPNEVGVVESCEVVGSNGGSLSR